MSRQLSWVVLVCVALLSCTVPPTERDGGRPGDASIDGSRGDASPFDAGPPIDVGPTDAPVMVDPDAACAMASVPVEVERLPVDVIWVVDNSGSMQPAIDQVRTGLNAFADQIFASGVDYRVILLSMRGTAPISSRYPICIPPPLAGDASCGDGDRFFHVDVDIKSTQPIEQILGTLGQTVGYTEGAAIGSAPWRHLLRDGATKTIVVVTDDNARTCARPHSGGSCNSTGAPMTETSLEDYPGGISPWTTTRALGPGILTSTYGSLFEGYTFDAIYGWGSETDPSARCAFPDGTMPSSPGYTYTTLVARTGGVRAQICDGAAAWGPFFDAVATSVVRNSRIACEVALPPPPDGSVLDPRRVNVVIRGASGSTTIPYSVSADGCDPARGGWHYDDASAPTRVILCPSSCDFAREETATTSGGLDVVFGCASILI
ncbi:MAG: hypothetical protein M3Y87_20635 [Myxococcota bacterium]|nr:hypothetical protein [Myxococcota bacterium]